MKSGDILRPMQAGEVNVQAVRQELEKVLSSGGFLRSERLSRFLRFVVERHLEGRDAELKEPLIATEIYGRKPDYDPKQDSVVRTEAARLRARLLEYYAGEGKGDVLIIEVPKGGYTPVFRQPDGAHKKQGSRSRWLLVAVALAALMLTLTAVGWWRIRQKSEPISIAVLPLDNLSHDPADDYFADGFTDEIIRNLSVIEGLAVRSRTSSFAFKGRPRNALVGKQLEVDYILDGSVLRVGQQLRVNVQLVRVHDDSPLWSARYDRELSDVFAIQDEISLGIVNGLRLKLGRGRRRYETSLEAYDLYLRARALAIQRGAPGMVEAIGPFEQASAKDPSFAPAYAGLAAAYATRSVSFVLDHPPDELAKMRAAAEKAIQLDPLLAEAYDALGMVYVRDSQWEQAEKTFRHAIQLDPNRTTTYVHFAAWLLSSLGRIDEQLQQLRVAEKIDPLSPEVHRQLAAALTSFERYDEAVTYCQKFPGDDPNKSQCLARARLGQGRIDEAIQLLEADHFPSASVGFLGYAYARAGRRKEAEELAAANWDIPNRQALTYAGLGDKDRTLEALDRMAPYGAIRVGLQLTFPEMALLRGDPRLKALRKKVGLPE
jgi:TolB-like protein